MIVWKTNLDTLPQSCRTCNLYQCQLPTTVRGDKILKAYMTKRHPKCPLCEIPDTSMKEAHK